MAYNDEFFAAYAAYQQEPTVARVHQRMIDFARNAAPGFENVLDLGCGASEYLVRAQPDYYFGIDENPRPPGEELTGREYPEVRHVERLSTRYGHAKPSAEAIEKNWSVCLNPVCECFYRADYRNMGFGWLPQTITSFVSLFSTEIMHWSFMNMNLYERLFREMPMVTAGLVSGFYYSDRATTVKVKEAGGIESYQTTERPHTFQSKLFAVTELVAHVPSQFFGPKVWEVWRLLERRPPL